MKAKLLGPQESPKNFLATRKGSLYSHIFMAKQVNGKTYMNSSEVAQLAGIHRLTLLRWIRDGKMPDVSRDRNGWRIFSQAEADAIASYATSVNDRSSPAQTVLFPVRKDGNARSFHPKA
jgi:excisionase family DNA binding protein